MDYSNEKEIDKTLKKLIQTAIGMVILIGLLLKPTYAEREITMKDDPGLFKAAENLRRNLDILDTHIKKTASILAETGLTGSRAEKALRKLASIHPAVINACTSNADVKLLTVESPDYSIVCITPANTKSMENSRPHYRGRKSRMSSKLVLSIEEFNIADIEYPILSRNAEQIGSVSLRINLDALFRLCFQEIISEGEANPIIVTDQNGKILFSSNPDLSGDQSQLTEDDHMNLQLERDNEQSELPRFPEEPRPGAPSPTETNNKKTPGITVEYLETRWQIMRSGNGNRFASREGFIPVKGGRVFYRIINPDKKGIPLLVIHGGPGLNHHYLEPLRELAVDRPVIFYDQLGCGQSDRPDDDSLWTLERYVDELETVLDTLKLDKAFLLGQSWGAMLAVEYMVTREPRTIAGLVLSGPCLSAELFARDQRKYLEQFPESIMKTILESEKSGNFDSPEYQEAVDTFYRRHVCRMDPWPECLNRSLSSFNQKIYNSMWGPSEFTVTGSLKSFDRTGDLDKLGVPVLYTCGEYDEASPGTTRFYHLKTPNSQLKIFSDTSHSHHLEKPEEYLEVVGEFLKRLDSTGK